MRETNTTLHKRLSASVDLWQVLTNVQQHGNDRCTEIINIDHHYLSSCDLKDVFYLHSNTIFDAWKYQKEVENYG
jgi:hypothetical protein